MYATRTTRSPFTTRKVQIAAVFATALLTGSVALAASGGGDAPTADAPGITTAAGYDDAVGPIDATSPATAAASAQRSEAMSSSTTDASTTTSAPAASQPEPEDAPPDPSAAQFEEEPPAPGNPGEVGGGGPAEVPDDPPAPTPPALDAVDLAPVPQPEPPDPPEPPVLPAIDFVAPTDDPEPPHTTVGDLVAVPPSPGIGSLAGNESGCALQCVKKAILQPNAMTPDVSLEVETTVAARIDVTLTDSVSGGELLFTSSGFKTKWQTVLQPLVPDRSYDLVLEAIDEDGQKQVHTHQFTTIEPVQLPGDLVGNATGCALQCITAGVVDHTAQFDVVSMHVTTDTPASLAVWVSTSEPGWVGGTPILPATAQVAVPGAMSTEWTFDVGGLAPDTTYHAIVRAEDENGQANHRIGSFHTAEEPSTPVRVEFEKVFVQWDGDPHWGGLDRGELSFAWGFDGQTLGTRGEEKLYGGDTVVLSSHNAQWFEVEPGAHLPTIMLSGTERDVAVGYCSYGYGVSSQPAHIKDCGWKINVATMPAVTVEMIEAMPSCAEFDLDADRRCASMFTPDKGDDYAKFQVIVSFQLG